QCCAAATTFSSPARTFHPSETPSWASIRAATGAGPISTAIFPIIARRHSACSAWWRMVRPWRAQWPLGTPPILRRRSLLRRAPAAWRERRQNGRDIRKALRWRRSDVLRITGAHLPTLGYQELDTGHGKLSAELDLRARGDADILRGLVRKADV